MGKAVYVDFDGTLVHYDGWKGVDHVGPPVEKMVNLVKKLLDRGVTVKIFTARVSTYDPIECKQAVGTLNAWCIANFGQVLEVTNVKGQDMVAMLDDRAISVKSNTGAVAGFDLSAIEEALDA